MIASLAASASLVFCSLAARSNSWSAFVFASRIDWNISSSYFSASASSSFAWFSWRFFSSSPFFISLAFFLSLTSLSYISSLFFASSACAEFVAVLSMAVKYARAFSSSESVNFSVEIVSWSSLSFRFLIPVSYSITILLASICDSLYFSCDSSASVTLPLNTKIDSANSTKARSNVCVAI